MAGDYYRMVFYHNKTRKRDFLSPHDRKIKPELEETVPCLRRSISLYSKIEDAKNQYYQHPGLPYRYIAKIHLPGKHGIIHQTPENNDSHHDWWIPEGVDPTQYSFIKIDGPY
jgi:hypothetical protein